MKPDQLYNKFRQWNERLSVDIRSFGAMNGAKNTIKMRDYKGHLYIFQYESDDKWALYYGAAATNFERSLKNDHS